MLAAAGQRRSAVWVVAAWLPRLVVAALFVYTGSSKILDLGTFVKEVRAYQLIPLAWSNGLAYVLPWLEVLAAALLLIGLWRREARVLLIVMLVVFTAAKSYVLARGLKIECGCVPTGSMLHFLFDGPIGIVTNVALLLLLALEAYAGRRARTIPAPPATQRGRTGP